MPDRPKSWMPLLSFEVGTAAYRADFLLYGAAVAALAAALVLRGPEGQRALLAGCAASGLALWSLAEYGLHRFVLHRVPLFCRWHADHHRRPHARIGTPTLLSAALFVGGVFMPARALIGSWPAGALLLGMLTGYLIYGITHHAAHHASRTGAWLRTRRLVHARHHRHRGGATCFGVTSTFWDRVFGTLGQ